MGRSWRGGVWAGVAAFGASCLQLPHGQVLKTFEGGRPIVVLQSSDNPVLAAPLAAFVQAVDAPVHAFGPADLNGPKHLVRAIYALQPAMVFTLGTAATLQAQGFFEDLPVMFAAVVNHRRYGLSGEPNFMGIALEPAPYAEFLQFKMVYPRLRRVVAFYVRRHSDTLVAEAKRQLLGLGIELVAVPVADANEVEVAYRERPADIDGVWLLNDPVIMNENTFSSLLELTQRDGLPLMTSMSERFAEAGALMSVTINFRSLGEQAAALAMRVLRDGEEVGAIGIQAPIGSSLVVNARTAQKLGLKIRDDIMPFLNRLIE